MKRKAQGSLLALIGAVLLAAAGYLLVSGKDPGTVQAHTGVTTEQAAAQAGAQLLPRDSKLGFEPK